MLYLDRLDRMQRRLFIATTNAGKLRDFQAAIGTIDVLLEPLPGMTHIPVPDEDADTFEGNARLKAVAYSLHLPGEMVLADDSGLEVDALGGRPGVYSARYAALEHFANPHSLPADDLNNACLLDRMALATERSARYRCVLAAARNGLVVAIAEGVVGGWLLSEPQGDGGFGYDPLFLLPAWGVTMAELDLATRLTVSHRGQALRALLALLDEQ